MKLKDSIINRLSTEIGASAQPYRIFANGEWVDTGCIAWPLPRESEEAHSVISEYNRLTQQLFVLLHESGLDTELAKISSESENIKLDKLSETFIELIKGSEKSSEIEAVTTELKELMSPYEPTMVQGIPVVSASELTASDLQQGDNNILWKVRDLLKDEPVIAYRANLNWMAFDVSFASFLVVAHTINQYDILRIEHTNAGNYGFDTECVIAKLKELDTKYGIDIVGAGFDVVEFLLKYIPKGKEACNLGKWLLDFCPDIDEAPTKFKGQIALWWD